MQDRSHPTFAGLLRSTVEEPGTLSSAYHAFHAYSLDNQLLAMFQCHERGLKPGPMATFPRWKELDGTSAVGEDDADGHHPGGDMRHSTLTTALVLGTWVACICQALRIENTSQVGDVDIPLEAHWYLRPEVRSLWGAGSVLSPLDLGASLALGW